jgi:hypothetical protein
VILSVSDFYDRNQIRKSVESFLEKVDFWDTPKKTPTPEMFAAFDYVICTIKTPDYIFNTLSALLTSQRVRKFSRSMVSLVEGIKELPLIPL